VKLLLTLRRLLVRLFSAVRSVIRFFDTGLIAKYEFPSGGKMWEYENGMALIRYNTGDELVLDKDDEVVCIWTNDGKKVYGEKYDR
jgi:hypothetical protein